MFLSQPRGKNAAKPFVTSCRCGVPEPKSRQDFVERERHDGRREITDLVKAG